MPITRIEIANDALMHEDGSGPVRNLDMDTHGFWSMSGLLIALVVATPIPWRRRLRAIAWGIVAIHVFILVTVTFSIWNESHYVSLVTFSPVWQRLNDKVESALISQLGLAAPVIIWVLVTFRKQDRTIIAPAIGQETLCRDN